MWPEKNTTRRFSSRLLISLNFKVPFTAAVTLEIYSFKELEETFLNTETVLKSSQDKTRDDGKVNFNRSLVHGKLLLKKFEALYVNNKIWKVWLKKKRELSNDFVLSAKY